MERCLGILLVRKWISILRSSGCLSTITSFIDIFKWEVLMGDKPISFRDKDGNFISAADVWNAEKLEELFNTLNPNRRLRLEREKLAKEKAGEAEDQES